MIRLDWDGIANDEMERRIEIIKKNSIVETIEVRASPSRDGYHIIIESYHSLNPVFIWRLRRAWKDDGFRLVKDVFSKNKYRDVMFQSKVIRGMGRTLLISEEKMFKCKRLAWNSGVWKNVSIE